MISTGHIWLIGILLIVVLIIWGPGKLPDVGAGLGRAINEFRRASTTTRDEFNKATRPEETPAAAAAPMAAPVTPVTAAPVAATPLPDAAPLPVTPVPAPIGGGPETAVAPADPVAEGDHKNHS